MARMTPKAVAVLSLPLTAAIGLGVAIWLRDDGGAAEVRRRDRAELDAQIERERRDREGDPAIALQALRAAPGPDARAPRAEILRHGERSVPGLMTAVRDPKEPTAFRLECLALLSDLNTPSADAVVLEILGDRTVEEKYRSLAVSKLIGRPVEAAFPVLRKIYGEEAGFAHRELLIKAIGAGKDPETTVLLLDAARAEKTAGARIQAVECLGARISEQDVRKAVVGIVWQAPEESVRVAAVAALGTSQDPSVDMLLRELSADALLPAGLRKAAASWLAKRAKR